MSGYVALQFTLTCDRFEHAFSSQEEIDTGDLSRAGPAYEAIEDSAVDVFQQEAGVQKNTTRLRNILDDGWCKKD